MVPDYNSESVWWIVMIFYTHINVDLSSYVTRLLLSNSSLTSPKKKFLNLSKKLEHWETLLLVLTVGLTILQHRTYFILVISIYNVLLIIQILKILYLKCELTEKYLISNYTTVLLIYHSYVSLLVYVFINVFIN